MKIGLPISWTSGVLSSVRRLHAPDLDDPFRRVCGFVLLSLTAACGPPTTMNSDRLVAGSLSPSKADLVRETIEINRGYGGRGYGAHRLTFALSSNDVLTVTHLYVPDDKIVGKETFTLPSRLAENARQQLWRIRPAKLEGYAADVRPLGCKTSVDDDFGDVTVLFYPDEETFGFFTLPYPGSCNNAAAKKARTTLEGVLAMFPSSKVAESFLVAKKASQ